MKRPEQALQQTVAGYLAATVPLTIWFHVPNGGGRSKVEGAILKSMGTRAGVADLCIIHEGRAHFIELKAGKGGLNINQKIFQADCLREGVPYAVCKTLEEVEGTLQGWGLIMRGRIAA